ncbi:MAG: hypothetical protein HY290_01035 [Planctomycetia bacterium]|nr:hypothetical protein [Planctomycetia bacterium]
MPENSTASGWRLVLTLDRERRVIGGSAVELRLALRRGADLRIYSEFYHDEHIDPGSDNHDLIQESMDMRATYLVDERWAAGVLTLRQPVELPDRFGPKPSLSLFLYNEDGQQAIARPFLDGAPATGPFGPSPPADHSRMPKYRELDRWDDKTNAPSSNFIYEFETLKYFVREDWREVLHHAADGTALSGSIDALAEAFRRGAEFKIAIRGLCGDLAGGGALPHEVMIQLGSCYYYTQQKLFIAGAHPAPRICPQIPMCYASRGWDYTWLLPRTDGHVALLIYDPYTLIPRRAFGRFEMRWFCR